MITLLQSILVACLFKLALRTEWNALSKICFEKHKFNVTVSEIINTERVAISYPYL